ncbi:MAG TPA: glutathione S-transferase family protein [Alphaproteobacteria bacterium]|jgi:glutathione S-transferase
MKLFSSPASPYVRMVEAVSILKGLDQKIEKLRAREAGVDLGALNPLNKIPTLTTDDGETLIESALICQYLDEIGQGPKLYGADPAARRRMLQLEALGHGVLDAAVACRMEVREHTPDKQSAPWIERQQKKLDLGFAAIETALDKIGPTLGVPHVTYACMLFFVDHHKVFESWRDKHPKLAAWYADVRKQPALAKTEPKPA